MQNSYNLPFKQNINYGIKIPGVGVAPALSARIYGDKSAFYDCAFLGVQDTLSDVQGRHHFFSCYIEGAVDFIFGAGQSFYEVRVCIE
jgi:pectinesterase